MSLDIRDSDAGKPRPPTIHFDNPAGLARDLSQLGSMPGVYDVQFTVGKSKSNVGGVRAILAARSRVFMKMLFPSPGGRTDSANPTHNAAPKKHGAIKHGFTMFKREVQSRVDHKPQHVQTSSIVVEDIEPLEFSRLMEFLHYGSCTLEARCIVGLLAASDLFAVEDLQTAIWNFLDKCIKADTVCHLFLEAEKYIQFKQVKALIPRLLEFTAANAGDILGLVPFCSLPQHIVRLILSRADLNATEWDKFTAALAWGRTYCKKHEDACLKDDLEPLIECIAFQKVPTHRLMQEVRQLGVVPDHVLLNALAYQADPTSVQSVGDRLTPEREQTQATGKMGKPRDSYCETGALDTKERFTKG